MKTLGAGYQVNHSDVRAEHNGPNAAKRSRSAKDTQQAVKVGTGCSRRDDVQLKMQRRTIDFRDYDG